MKMKNMTRKKQTKQKHNENLCTFQASGFTPLQWIRWKDHNDRKDESGKAVFAMPCAFSPSSQQLPILTPAQQLLPCEEP